MWHWSAFIRKPVHWGLGLLSVAVAADLRAQHTLADSMGTELMVLLQESCMHCHGSELAEGGFRVDLISTDVRQLSSYDRWRQVLQRIESGEMPPASEPQLAPSRKQTLSKHIRASLAKADEWHRAGGRTTLRRLNRTEYQNTVRQLFSSQVEVSQMLPEDPVSHGFDTIGSALSLSAVQMERYLEAADVVLEDALKPVHQEPIQKQRFDLYDSLPSWFLAGVWKQDEGVVLYRNGGSSTPSSCFQTPARNQLGKEFGSRTKVLFCTEMEAAQRQICENFAHQHRVSICSESQLQQGSPRFHC